MYTRFSFLSPLFPSCFLPIFESWRFFLFFFCDDDDKNENDEDDNEAEELKSVTRSRQKQVTCLNDQVTKKPCDLFYFPMEHSMEKKNKPVAPIKTILASKKAASMIHGIILIV